MDPYSRHIFELNFKVAFLEKKGEEFQNFFSSIMEKRHPNGDFIRTRPWGRVGDRKNDGYLRSERTLFQCYAPAEVAVQVTLNKIDEDYWGALPYWQDYFEIWAFVHNAGEGLPPQVEERLLHLDQGNSNIRVRPWGFEEIRQRLFGLSQEDLTSLLGPVPSRTELLNVKVPELESVLLHIGSQQPLGEADVRPVPGNKLEANGLSHHVRALLNLGKVTSDCVKVFFHRFHDPTLGDRVAKAFRVEYERLRALHYSADRIFTELQGFAGAHPPAMPARQAAVLTVLAYLFEECDIYERPEEDHTS